jgi:hypothetical protein
MHCAALCVMLFYVTLTREGREKGQNLKFDISEPDTRVALPHWAFFLDCFYAWGPGGVVLGTVAC